MDTFWLVALLAIVLIIGTFIVVCVTVRSSSSSSSSCASKRTQSSSLCPHGKCSAHQPSAPPEPSKPTMAQLLEGWFDRSTTHWNDASNSAKSSPPSPQRTVVRKKAVKFVDDGQSDGEYFRPPSADETLRSRTKTWRFDRDEAPTVIEGRRSFSFGNESDMAPPSPPSAADRQLLKLDWNTATDLAGKEPLLVFYSLEGCSACNRFRPDLVRMLSKLDVQAIELESKDVPKHMLPPEFPTLLYVAPGHAPVMLDSDHGIDAVIARVNELAAGKKR